MNPFLSVVLIATLILVGVHGDVLHAPSLYPGISSGACKDCESALTDRTPNSVLGTGFIDAINSYDTADGSVTFGNVDSTFASIDSVIAENSTSIADNTGKGHRVSTTGAVSLHSNNDIEFIVAGNLNLESEYENIEIEGLVGEIFSSKQSKFASEYFVLSSQDGLDFVSDGNVTVKGNDVDVLASGGANLLFVKGSATISALEEFELRGSAVEVLTSDKFVLGSDEENIHFSAASEWRFGTDTELTVTTGGMTRLGGESNFLIDVLASQNSTVTGKNLAMDGIDGVELLSGTGAFNIQAGNDVHMQADELTANAQSGPLILEATEDIVIKSSGTITGNGQYSMSADDFFLSANDAMRLDSTRFMTISAGRSIDASSQWVDFESGAELLYSAGSSIYVNARLGNILMETTSGQRVAEATFEPVSPGAVSRYASSDFTMQAANAFNIGAPKTTLESNSMTWTSRSDVLIDAENSLIITTSDTLTATALHGVTISAGDSVMIESFASGITLEARDSFSSTAATTSFTGGDVEIQGLHQVSLSAPDGTSRVESDEAMTATSGGEVLFDGGNVEVFTSGTDKSIIWSATNDRKTMSISSSALTETTSSGLKWTSESGDIVGECDGAVALYAKTTVTANLGSDFLVDAADMISVSGSSFLSKAFDIAFVAGVNSGTVDGNTVQFHDADVYGYGEALFSADRNIGLATTDGDVVLEASVNREDALSFMSTNGNAVVTSTAHTEIVGGDVNLVGGNSVSATAQVSISISSATSLFPQDVSLTAENGHFLASGDEVNMQATSAYYSAGAFLDVTSSGNLQIIAAGEGDSIFLSASSAIEQEVGGNSVVLAQSAGIFIEAGRVDAALSTEFIDRTNCSPLSTQLLNSKVAGDSFVAPCDCTFQSLQLVASHLPLAPIPEIIVEVFVGDGWGAGQPLLFTSDPIEVPSNTPTTLTIPIGSPFLTTGDTYTYRVTKVSATGVPGLGVGSCISDDDDFYLRSAVGKASVKQPNSLQSKLGFQEALEAALKLSSENSISAVGVNDASFSSGRSLKFTANGDGAKVISGSGFDLIVDAESTNLQGASVSSTSVTETVIRSDQTILAAGTNSLLNSGANVVLNSGQRVILQSGETLSTSSGQKTVVVGGSVGWFAGDGASLTAATDLTIASSCPKIGNPNDYDLTIEGQAMTGTVDSFLYMSSFGIDDSSDLGFRFQTEGDMTIQNAAANAVMTFQGDDGIFLASDGQGTFSGDEVTFVAENGKISFNAKAFSGSERGIEFSAQQDTNDITVTASKGNVWAYGNGGVVSSSSAFINLQANRGIYVQSRESGGDITYSSGQTMTFTGLLDISLTAGYPGHELQGSVVSPANGEVVSHGDIVALATNNAIRIQSMGVVRDDSGFGITLENAGTTASDFSVEADSPGKEILVWAGQDVWFKTEGTDNGPDVSLNAEIGVVHLEAQDGSFSSTAMSSIQFDAQGDIDVHARGQQSDVFISSADDWSGLAQRQVQVTSRGSQTFSASGLVTIGGSDIRFQSKEGDVRFSSDGITTLAAQAGQDAFSVEARNVDLNANTRIVVDATGIEIGGSTALPQVIVRSAAFTATATGGITASTDLEFTSRAGTLLSQSGVDPDTGNTVIQSSADIFFKTTGATGVTGEGDIDVEASLGDVVVQLGGLFTMVADSSTVTPGGSITYSSNGRGSGNGVNVLAEQSLFFTGTDAVFLEADKAIDALVDGITMFGAEGQLSVTAGPVGGTQGRLLVDSDEQLLIAAVDGDDTEVQFTSNGAATGPGKIQLITFSEDSPIVMQAADDLFVTSSSSIYGQASKMAAVSNNLAITTNGDNGDVMLDAVADMFLESTGGGLTIQVDSASFLVESNGQIEISSSGAATVEAGSLLEFESGNGGDVQFQSRLPMTMSTTAFLSDVTVDSREDIVVRTDGTFLAQSSLQEVIVDAVGTVEFTASGPLSFLTQDARFEESDIDLLAVDGRISFQGTGRALFATSGIESDVDVSSSSDISFVVYGNQTINTFLAVDAGSRRLDVDAYQGDINMEGHRRVVVEQSSNDGFLRLLATQATAGNGNTAVKLLTTHEAGDIVADATNGRTVLDGSHGVKLYATGHGFDAGVVSIVANGFEATNKDGISVTTNGDRISPLPITFDSGGGISASGHRDVRFSARSIRGNTASVSIVGRADSAHAVRINSARDIVIESEQDEFVIDAGNGRLHAQSQSASLTGDQLQIAASRTLYVAAEPSDNQVGITALAKESIAVESRRSDINIRASGVRFESTDEAVNFRGNEIIMTTQLDIGGNPTSVTFDSTEGTFTSQAPSYVVRATNAIEVEAQANVVITADRISAFSQSDITLSTSNGASNGNGRIVLNARRQRGVAAIPGTSLLSKNVHNEADTSSGGFVDFQPSFAVVAPNGPALALPLFTVMSPTGTCEHDRELRLGESTPHSTICVCDSGAWFCAFDSV